MLRTIELVENGEIMCSRCIGFIWRPQLRSRKKPIQQHQALRRIMEYFSMMSGDVLLMANTVFHDPCCVRAFADSILEKSYFSSRRTFRA